MKALGLCLLASGLIFAADLTFDADVQLPEIAGPGVIWFELDRVDPAQNPGEAVVATYGGDYAVAVLNGNGSAAGVYGLTSALTCRQQRTDLPVDDCFEPFYRAFALSDFDRYESDLFETGGQRPAGWTIDTNVVVPEILRGLSADLHWAESLRTVQ